MILFLPYVGVGVFTGVNAHDLPHWSFKSLLILAGVYAAFAAFAWFLATKSRTSDGRPRFGLPFALSPAAWCIGFTLAFVVGVAMPLFV
jgi:hypothetical protein